MSNIEKKGITTKVDMERHAKARQYMAEHDNMKMEEFISKAIDSLVDAKEQAVEKKPVMRTLAFQVPESFYQEVKDYLERHDMKQNRFVIGLIRQELDRDMIEAESLAKKQNESITQAEEADEEQSEGKYNEEIIDGEDEPTDAPNEDEELTENDEPDEEQDENEENPEESENEEEAEDEDIDEDEEETEGMSMTGM